MLALIDYFIGNLLTLGKDVESMNISVIIPLYNKGVLVRRALESVACQNALKSSPPQAASAYNISPLEVEIIVVDDGSTDDSLTHVSTFVRNNVWLPLRLIKQENAGVSAARNRGISEAKGEYVAFLDADDEWLPDHLGELARLAHLYPQCDIFATNYENKLPDGTTLPNRLRGLTFEGEEGIIDNYFVMAADSNPPLWTSAVMVRREAILSVGAFPIGIKSGEDLLTWARLAITHKIAFSTAPSAIYHRGNSNPRPPETMDEVGSQLEILYHDNRSTPRLKRYLALWYNMRMSRCLAHRMYGKATKALRKSLRYHPTIRIVKPLFKFTIFGIRNKQSI